MLFTAILLSLAPALALGRPKHDQSGRPRSEHESHVRLLHEYPLGHFVEGIAVRPNGELLLTLPYIAEVHSINPLHSDHTPKVVHKFQGISSVFGITEYDHDVYAVNGGNFSIEEGSVVGTYRVDSLDLTGAEPKAARIADFPTAQFLNGMTFLPQWGPGPRNVLVNDVIGGVVYHLDPTSGDYHVALNNTYTQAHQHPVLGSFGVNGIKIGDGMAYLTNTGLGALVRFPIHPNGTEVEGGPVEILSRQDNSTWFYDDFALRDTTAYVTTGSGNSIERVVAPSVGAGGLIGTDIVAGSLNSTAVAGPTAAAFGRTDRDRHILYVTTSGAANVPVDGKIRVGAQVLAVDTRLCTWI
ncbi:hypothetical protein ACKRZS_004201 [Fusarium odoratissimum]|uniref:SMP-30/Gluconolactonase/LRE-like region domain-containing protein n=2 Tax=Fusarium oxysporum species complex TaxID=171631 RepID=X0IWY0_FUSO5|nr:uncharacterized protein FOIG_13608 [Fusarium odoratissimum NRRL 54006]EXL93473.1 hypothetical protein FOIG_13608 [Fusarium odoratissimum NRRL 54006]KAK2135995.1 hypothetical protein NOF04DRAFT_13767 [Fusarium oxysporum II5]TXC05419.1 hypothetical protein FocTR4_00000107 [Fusarium oxysporum f. sp. cubense]